MSAGQHKQYSIKELASLFDISSRTIRYYEEMGLIKSVDREEPSEQRSFTDSERRRLKLILRGKRLGFSLQEIKEMVELYESNPKGQEEKKQILDITDQKLKQIEEKLFELQTAKADILAYREKFQND
ncbi:MerR family transcriptional regulator [Salicibibacter halophilus]|uniref:MerR family transcriptional regulator n=1 Tax=Salicibibacter halophilus TaxID=2502791 RepID=A0A514LIM6_9BACI|nr:MerR family DNA-binding protein [Salicibibacter halophilus]QDI91704.1 MerR family transcriptional regulator [Salicibibacter halophilus]